MDKGVRDESDAAVNSVVLSITKESARLKKRKKKLVMKMIQKYKTEKY